LQQIGRRATEAAQRLDRGTQTELETQELRTLVHSLRKEIADEYRRLTAGKAQKVLTLFELNVYVPAIEGIWNQADVKGLNTDGAMTSHWGAVLTEVASRLSHYC
jgi:hypothetical protein